MSNGHPDWPLQTRVAKKGEAQWRGLIVGYYSTPVTKLGLVVMSEAEDSMYSVQNYSCNAVDKIIENT